MRNNAFAAWGGEAAIHLAGGSHGEVAGNQFSAQTNNYAMWLTGDGGTSTNPITYLDVHHNDVTQVKYAINTPYVGIVRIHDNPGYNPVGSSVPGTAFALPASGTAWTNDTAVDGTLYVTAAGTVSDVVVQGVTVASSLAVGQSWFVPAGGTITFTYTTAPTLVFVGN